MLKGRYLRRFSLVCCWWACVATILILCVKGTGCYGAEIDWTRYCIDGVQLTGNYDTRYLKADPAVDATIPGREKSAVDGLFDSYGNTSVSWNPAEPVDITVDLKKQCSISCILTVISGGKDRGWKIGVSPDSQSWHTVSNKRFFSLGCAGSLAAVARYLRIQAEPGASGVTISDIYIYGEKEAGSEAIGGIYPSRYPPVANEAGELRAVIRNTTAQPFTNLKVVFEQEKPTKGVLGETLGETMVEQLDPYSAAVASIPWKPEVTEPHAIIVRVSGQGLSVQQTASKIIPVVNRRIYLTGYSPMDNERLVHYNLYNNCAGTEYYMAKLHGKTSLIGIEGPCVIRGQSADYWEKKWGEALSRADGDGIVMDEWALIGAGGQPEPGAYEALKRIHGQYKGKKLIAPWLIGDMDEPGSTVYQNCDIILSELYISVEDNNAYRRLIDSMVDSFRKWGFLDRAVPAVIPVLAIGFSGESSTHEELERETAYLRYHGPEMPGIGFYGYDRAGYYTLFTDNLSYKYFIAPVVTVKQPPAIEGQKVTVTLRNIGGMNAHDVRIEALNWDGKRLGEGSVKLLKAGQEEKVVLNLSEKEGRLLVRLLSGDYTALNPPKQLEVLPGRQAQGGPLQISWELEPARIRDDRIEFLKESTKEVVHQVKNDGSWMLKGATTVSTTSLPPDRYLVRLVDGKTGKARTLPDQVEIVSSLGKFSVTAVNDKPWKGDPQSISLKPGDTFEVSWDFGGKEVSGPAIYLSAPGEPLRAVDQANQPFAMTKIKRLRDLMKTPAGEPMLAGRWTWPTSPQPKDLLKNGGWLAQRGAPGDTKDDSRINMSAKPGEWKLWIGTDFGPKTPFVTLPPNGFGAIPVTPVVTVTVLP